MNLQKDLSELLEAKVITQETADKIRDYYRQNNTNPVNRLFIVFGILGAILVGLGIILMIAHNWDSYSRFTKSFFAFLPLATGQLFCAYILLRRRSSIAWRESGTAFLFFAVGACISLVSQIYNIPGNLSSFLLTWMLLSVPLVYIMNSSVGSLLYIVGITYYAGETGYWSYPSTESYLYWGLLALILPHYYQYFKVKTGNFFAFHNWFVPLSVIIALGTFTNHYEELMFAAYFSLFGLFLLIGNLELFDAKKSFQNSFRVLGSLGTLVLLLILSFDWFWEDLYEMDKPLAEVILSPEFFATAIISILAIGLFSYQSLGKKISEIELSTTVFIVFLLIFLIGIFSPVAVVLINLVTFALGVYTIRKGALEDHLGVMNYGLLIITALVVCRFFDTDLSYVLRGLMFLVVGVSFFVANFLMLKKRKTNEPQ